MIKHITEAEQRLTNTLRTTTEALTLVTAERDALLARNKEHEQFRHQHRDCSQMALERDALKAAAERYRKAAQMAVELIETNAHERRHVRWALIEAMKGTS